MGKKDKRKITKESPAPRGRDFDSLFSRSPIETREVKWIVVVFAVALAVRLAYFFVNKANNPLFYHPILDALFHHEWAEEIISGKFWGDEVFFRAPLYPYLIAFLYKLSGSSIAFATLVQHVVGSLSVALLYVLGRQYFSVRVSLLAAVVAALYWPLIYFEGDLLIVTYVVFFDIALLLCLTAAIRRRSVSLYAAAGLILGISAVARPSILILVPVLPLVFHASAPRVRGAQRGRTWQKQTVLVVSGALVVILPVVIRNFVVGRDLVPIASQGGVNFYIGNNPQSNGSLAMVPGARADMYGTYHGAIELAERDRGRKLKPSEVSNYYTGKALDFIVSSPDDALALTAKKLYLFWAGVERSNNKYIQFFWERYGFGRFPLPGFWLVGPFALLGGALLFRRRRHFSLLYLFVLSYMVGVVAFFVNARFRLPVVPVLILFASYALWHIVESVRAKSPDLIRVTLILIVCVFVVDYDFIAFRGVRAIDEAISHYELANAFLKEGDKDGALHHFEEARKIQEKYPTRAYLQISGTVDFNLGSIYYENGLYSRAIEALERVPDTDPRVYQAKTLLADCYVRRGRYEDAINIYTRILQADPDNARSLFGIGVAYRMTGDFERSQRALEDVIEKHHPTDGSVHLELARTCQAAGDTEGAVRNYRIAAASNPQRRDAYLELARLYKKAGDTEKAIEYYERLRTAYPNDKSIQMEINALRSGN
jgi:tetratricopeptide (TPR) repeat protein